MAVGTPRKWILGRALSTTSPGKDLGGQTRRAGERKLHQHRKGSARNFGKAAHPHKRVDAQPWRLDDPMLRFLAYTWADHIDFRPE